MLKRCLKIAPLSTALMFGGCMTVGPDFVAPELSGGARAPQKFDHGSGSQISGDDISTIWWRQIKDEVLQDLISIALANNTEIGIAVANIDAAEAHVDDRAADASPSVDLDVSADRSDQVDESTRELREIEALQTGIRTSWELDLFGRVRRMREVARASADQEIALAKGVRLSVVARVAEAYVRLQGSKSQQALLETTLRVTSEFGEKTVWLQSRGHATRFEVNRAERDVLEIRNAVQSSRGEQAAVINQLRVLTGLSRKALNEKLLLSNTIPKMPDMIHVGTPQQLLRRRPDILAAESRLHATTAQIGVEIADLFPSIRFDANIGIDIGNAVGATSSVRRNVFNFGPSINFALFNRNKIHARIREIDARARADLQRYQETIIRALAETDERITRHAADRERIRLLTESRNLAIAAVEFRTREQQLGASSVIEVLDASRSLLRAELDLVDARLTHAANVIRLYLALGGGWEHIS